MKSRLFLACLPRRVTTVGALVSLLALATAGVAQVVDTPTTPRDLELIAPDGRRVLLKSDGTWLYAADAAASAPAEAAVQAELKVLSTTQRGRGCRIALSLENKLPYDIRNVVPYFAARRGDDVVYETSNVAFIGLRPGDVQQRELDFNGIACSDIARVQVTGGDRCEMGELDRFSDAKGHCLARLKLLPSRLLRIEK